MTIGPGADQQDRVARSVRFGIVSRLLHQVDEAPEEVAARRAARATPRGGTAPRRVGCSVTRQALDGAGRSGSRASARRVRRASRRRPRSRGSAPVISTLPVVRSMHRLVAAVVAELELVGACRRARGRGSGARGRCRRSAPCPAAPRTFSGAYGDGVGIAGAVREEDAVGLQRQHVARRRRRGHDAHRAAGAAPGCAGCCT